MSKDKDILKIINTSLINKEKEFKEWVNLQILSEAELSVAQKKKREF